MSSVFEIAEFPVDQMMKIIRQGLPAQSFDQVAEVYRLSREALAGKLGLVPRTISRKRRANCVLSAGESEKILRAARVHDLAGDLFSTEEATSVWLKRPALPLKGAAPIDLLDTDFGAREVEGFIRGLAYGNIQ
jgi:putative toxin-antitoxin system antitoxin component (TIGR02293 family)